MAGPPGVPTGPPLRILYVESDDADAELFAEACHTAGGRVAVERVSTGRDALAFLQQAAPFEGAPSVQLVMTDLYLPDMSGIDLLDMLRGESTLPVMPIFILSGSRSRQDISRAYRSGVNAYIAKPRSLQQLAAVLSCIERFFGEAAAVVDTRENVRVPT